MRKELGDMVEVFDLSGVWQVKAGGSCGVMQVPGSLDESGIGEPDVGSNQWHPDEDYGNDDKLKEVFSYEESAPILTRFTRKHSFQGEATISRSLSFQEKSGKRYFLEVERARVLRLLIDGKEVPDFVAPCLNTPHIFEVTGLLEGIHTLTLLSDNSYPGLPAQDIIYSSAATDETQTNWNGLLGYVRIREEEETFLQAVRIYPEGDQYSICMEIAAQEAGEISLQGSLSIPQGNDRVQKDAVQGGSTQKCSTQKGSMQMFPTQKCSVQPGITEHWIRNLPMPEGAPFWDEEEGNLLTATFTLENGCSRRVTFGRRQIGYNEKGQLTLNGRVIFLRGEANCAVFPETGYAPMTIAEWEEILRIYASYGVNCMRFHSHCPPEAAFYAADRMGMLMQPELSHWNPRDAFEQAESASYYETELVQTIKYLANHPSFIMLTLGNELHCGEQGHGVMDHLMEVAHTLDATRLYANGSNVHYGAIGWDGCSDVYTAMQHYDTILRGTSAASDEKGMDGHINRNYPNASTDYHEVLEQIRQGWQKPVYGFEVGQFEVLPDLRELELFHGITRPDNIEAVRQKVEALGLMEKWEQYVEASGQLSRIGYREEVEAALRTEGFSGLSLLGLQDFPGQGTALVGMLNSHLQPKPYPFAEPEKFRAFFRSQLPLVLLPKYTFEQTENLQAEVKLANYGKNNLTGVSEYKLIQIKGTNSEEGQSRIVLAEGVLPECTCCCGGLTSVGEIILDFAELTKKADGAEALRLELEVNFRSIGLGQKKEGDRSVMLNEGVRTDVIRNTYPIWVYPTVEPQCPEGIYETTKLDAEAERILAQGGTVYLTPPATKEAMPHSIKTQFTTDFWSVGTFPAQEGSMGQFIDEKHPLFRHFPTESHTNWQWWPMASSRAFILSKPYQAIITEMDSYAYLRPMAQLLECRCKGGRLLLSSMGLQDLQQYPEARALLQAIYTYLGSEDFQPQQEIDWQELQQLVS